MALCKVGDILKKADAAKTSAIAFNCSDYNMIHALVTAAEQVHKPVICMLYPNHHRVEKWTTPELFATMVKLEAEQVEVPIGMHLDHCSDFDYLMRALKAGFQSVMYDGSMLPIEENIKNTAEFVKIAHALDAEVEAEIGYVGFANSITDQKNIDMYTKPDVAAKFCEQSGCDSVAIAIGSAHGFYKETPHLDIDRLKAINAATDTPLVLHGGSGIPDEQLNVAFREGINKFNVGTEFFWLYSQTLKAYDGDDITKLPRTLQEAFVSYLTKKLDLCKL